MNFNENTPHDIPSFLLMPSRRRTKEDPWDPTWPAQPSHGGSDGEDSSDESLECEFETISSETRISRIADEMKELPVHRLYPDIAEAALEALKRWRLRFMDRPTLWARFIKHKRKQTRVLKELNESAPIIREVLDMVARTELPEGQRFTIVDLCSGFGFLSMFLAEMLPPDKVEKIVLVDKMWPMRNQERAGPTQITWEHVRDPGWPIRLETRKQDIKKHTAWMQMDQHVVRRAQGPIVLLAVHLCGTLSLHAVRAFNAFKPVSMLILKPCCLPGKIHLHQTRERPWQLGQHRFTSADVYFGPAAAAAAALASSSVAAAAAAIESKSGGGGGSALSRGGDGGDGDGVRAAADGVGAPGRGSGGAASGAGDAKPAADGHGGSSVDGGGSDGNLDGGAPAAALQIDPASNHGFSSTSCAAAVGGGGRRGGGRARVGRLGAWAGHLLRGVSDPRDGFGPEPGFPTSFAPRRPPRPVADAGPPSPPTADEGSAPPPPSLPAAAHWLGGGQGEAAAAGKGAAGGGAEAEGAGGWREVAGGAVRGCAEQGIRGGRGGGEGGEADGGSRGGEGGTRKGRAARRGGSDCGGGDGRAGEGGGSGGDGRAGEGGGGGGSEGGGGGAEGRLLWGEPFAGAWRVEKELRHVRVQERHFQNLFLLARRFPAVPPHPAPDAATAPAL